MTMRACNAFTASIAAILVVSTLAANAKSNKVRLGYQYSLWGSPAVIALELDLFKKHGVEVDAKRFPAGKDARDALVANTLDVATVGGTPFVVGAAVGELNAIATVAYTGRTGCIEVRRTAASRHSTSLRARRSAAVRARQSTAYCARKSFLRTT